MTEGVVPELDRFFLCQSKRSTHLGESPHLNRDALQFYKGLVTNYGDGGGGGTNQEGGFIVCEVLPL